MLKKSHYLDENDRNKVQSFPDSIGDVRVILYNYWMMFSLSVILRFIKAEVDNTNRDLDQSQYHTKTECVITVCISCHFLYGHGEALASVTTACNITFLDLSPKKLLVHGNDINSLNNQDIENYPVLFYQSKTIIAFEYI